MFPSRQSLLVISFCLVAAVRPAPAQSSGPDLKFTGYVQSQYERISTDSGSHDRVLFRRIVLTAEVKLTEHWIGDIQADLAPVMVGDRLIIRDVFLRYVGFQDRGITVTLGNQKMPFSRSLLTSSSRRSLIERPITGDRGFGAPGRSIGAKVDGRNKPGTFQWSGAIASALHAPDAATLRVEGIATSDQDWNEGVLFSGRAEWHPLGPVVLEQGTFEPQPWRFTAAGAAYWWRNDGDRNLYTANGVSDAETRADLHDSLGFELSAALRGARLSIDAEVHRATGNTIDERFTGGLYRVGRARLLKSSVEAGYMILPARFEILAAVDLLDIEARDRRAWRPTLGANWYVARHRLKFQLMHRETFNALGVEGARIHTSYAQAQFIF